MSENGPTGVDPVPPTATLLQMMTGYWVSQALYVAAKLGVADLLTDGPRPVEDLATATQTDAPSLRRVSEEFNPPARTDCCDADDGSSSWRQSCGALIRP